MPDVKLLSNGKYHVMVTAEGSGYSRWNGLAVTRWREDDALESGGTFFYLRETDAEGSHVWSATSRPVEPGSHAVSPGEVPGCAVFMRRDHDLEVTTTVAVAAGDDVELRRIRMTNLSARHRTFSVTSFSEIVLSPPATDSAHPAFSKMFVETEIDTNLGAILATRRPSGRDDLRAWCFHQAVVRGGEAGKASYETSRSSFVGRCRDAGEPAALSSDAPLSGHAGPVLDAIAAVRVPLALAPGASCTVDFFTGVAGTREGSVALSRRYRSATADAVLAAAGGYRAALLQRTGAVPTDGAVFERLAGALLYARTTLRGDPGEIASNRRGQSALWGFGISGDVPIVLLQVTSADRLGLVHRLVHAHAFWAAHGIKSELMIVSGSGSTAQKLLFDQVRQAIDGGGGADIFGQPGGIFLRDDATLDAGDRILLRSVARIAVDGTHEDLDGQLEPVASASLPTPESRRSEPTQAPASVSAGDLLDFNGHGGFTPDQREYVIITSASNPPPAPWTNVIANAQFGTLISDSGSASTWSENAHELRLTPWSNDAVSDANTEALYIRDEESGRFWSPTLLPTRSDGSYVVRHGFGYSNFEHDEDGIQSELRVFVAIDSPVKFSALTLRNRSSRARRLSVTGYVEWVLGDERSKTLMHVVTRLDDETGALFASNAFNTDFAGRTAFFDVEGAERSACGDRGDFFGRTGSLAAPTAMSEAALSGRVGAALDPCGSLRVTFELLPDEEREIVFMLGAGKCEDEARALVRRWRGAEAARAALDGARAHWHRVLGVVQVHTPDRAIDALANGWLLYQVIASRLWARTGFYQSSGAFGFRDQLQDVMAIVHAEPMLVREHLLRSAARQFVEGDVQHWWHPPSGKGIRSRCSDDYLWLPFATCRYIEITGDDAVLDEPCAFLDSRLLKDGEQSDYELPHVSQESASLYEHAVRAIRHGLRYGAHGLPLMGAGDWNDGMNLVGVGGKGESVWLGFFLIAVLKRFAPVARKHADAAFAELCESEARALADQIEATSWDGDWYRRAYFDDGTPLGSASNSECRIDSIAQSWSVLSEAAPAKRAQRAMSSLHEHLVHDDARLVQLLDPPFDTSAPSPGYIQGYVPGVRENGGQYTHAAVWATLAFAALGDADRAWELFGLLAPMHHGDSAEKVATYKVEPYVVAGDIYALPPHTGRGGWTWYTGSAGWMYQLLVESLLGLERRGNRLRVRPLLRSDWRGFEMRYRFGDSTYEIAVRLASSAATTQLVLDGALIPEGVIALNDDGKSHSVVVDAWRVPMPLAA